MKRTLSVALSLALALGSLPARAQSVLGRAALPASMPAPTPVTVTALPAVGVLAPAAPSLAAALTPSLALAPSPVPYAAMPGLEPVKPAQASVPAPLAARVESSAPSPVESLRVAAAPSGSLVFDGALAHPAAASVEPPTEPEPAATPARRGLLQRYKDSRKNSPPLQTAFGKGMLYASMAAVALPPLLLAAPALKAGYALIAADLTLLAVMLPLSLATWIWKKVRGPQTASQPPPRGKRLAVFALGAVLGLGIGLAPYAVTGPVAERVAARLDLSRSVEDKTQVRWISGGAVEDETVKILSQNAVGRETLNALRDRFGVLRLPTFFISNQKDSYGEHEDFYDGVYLNVEEVTSRGWTVEQFLKDPALQRRLIREMDSTVLHELTHAVQGRRPPWRPTYFKNSVESEQQAFLQETLYRLAQLEANPKMANNGHDQWMLVDAADDLDAFLKSVAGMYEKNVVVGTDPDYNAYFAAQRARWPAFRVHIYQVLAAHATSPRTAKMYMDKARAAAKQAGLPEPADLIVSR